MYRFLDMTRNFQDILFDPHQLLWFKRFLVDHHSDAPLNFWQAVENMKNNTKDAKARQARCSAIVKKYFVNINSPASKWLCVMNFMFIQRNRTLRLRD